MLLGTSSKKHSRVPTPAPLSAHPQARATRNTASAPVRISGKRRTSNRPGLKIESGRRRLIFSFRLAQSGVCLHRFQRFSKKSLRAALHQEFGCRFGPVHDQPRNSPEAPAHVQPANLRFEKRRIHLVARLLPGLQKFHVPRELADPPHQLRPPCIRHLRDRERHPRRRPRLHHRHAFVGHRHPNATATSSSTVPCAREARKRHCSRFWLSSNSGTSGITLFRWTPITCPSISPSWNITVIGDCCRAA